MYSTSFDSMLMPRVLQEVCGECGHNRYLKLTVLIPQRSYIPCYGYVPRNDSNLAYFC